MCCSNKRRAAITAVCNKCGQTLTADKHVCGQPEVAPPKRLADKTPTVKPRKTIFLPY